MLLNNRYRITRTLASGGFGETFLAEDTQMPSRRLCVIKQLRPIQDNPQVYQLVRERFGREAAILEELGDGSFQIPRLYAYFSERGQFYLVQEYIEGKTLTGMVLELGIMDENSVKEILIGILPVLDYVHSKGIVHRDIKPENILINNVDGKPVLIDFGAVKETLGTLLTPSGNVTKSIVIGTPGFMATEQSVGRPIFASDIYSLGLTAIYLLTGKMPQELCTDPTTGKVLWRQYAPNVKDNFADILDKAIGFNSRERFSSASVMLQAVETGVLSLISGVSYVDNSDTIPPGVTLPPQNHPPQNHPPQNYQTQNYQTQNNIPQTHLNTVSIAPAVSIPSRNKVSSKGILLGSLIVGSLIGGSIIIGFALNKESQTLTKQIQTITKQPQTITPSRELENLNLNQPKNTSTPTVIPEVEPKIEQKIQPKIEQKIQPQIEPKVEQEIEPRIKPKIEPKIKPILPPTVNSDVTPEIEPSLTPEIPEINNPNPELPIPQETPLSPESDFTPPPIQQPSPAQAVENYYSRINKGQFKTAWNQLSPEFKDNKGLHPKGYFSYLSWWKGKVESVAVEQLKVIEANTDTATVDASLSYVMKNRRIIDSSVRFSLVWDAQNARWIVKDAG